MTLVTKEKAFIVQRLLVVRFPIDILLVIVRISSRFKNDVKFTIYAGAIL